MFKRFIKIIICCWISNERFWPEEFNYHPCEFIRLIGCILIKFNVRVCHLTFFIPSNFSRVYISAVYEYFWVIFFILFHTAAGTKWTLSLSVWAPGSPWLSAHEQSFLINFVLYLPWISIFWADFLCWGSPTYA